MRKEQWKQINYDGVVWQGQISNMGNVKGINGKERKLQRDKDGYHRIMLRRYFINDEGREVLALCNAPVHRLVAQNFLDGSNSKECVIHLNGKIRDNWHGNLAYADRKKVRLDYNVRQKEKKKMTEDGAKEIIELYQKGNKIKKIAEITGYAYHLVYQVANKKTWKHLEV